MTDRSDDTGEPTAAQVFAALLDAAEEQGLRFGDLAPPESRRCRVAGLRLHYLDWGRAGSPAMVLVHGRAVTAHAWDFFSLAMRARFHVYALDQRGHGDSEWAADGDYSRERHAADLAGFVEALGLDSLVLVGHSLGGAVSLLAAPQLGDRVRALVVVDSLLGPRSGPGPRFGEGPDVFPSLEAFAEHAARLNPRRKASRLLWSLRNNARQLPDGRWTWKYDRVLRDPRRPLPEPDFGALWQALRTLPCPILIVRAGEHSHIPAEAVPELEALAPRVRLTTVPHAAHSVMGDNPLAFERAVGEFLTGAGLDSAGSCAPTDGRARG